MAGRLIPLPAEEISVPRVLRGLKAAASYWQLTKPRIVLLLVFTTFTAMVVAAGGFRFPAETLGMTLLGGWLSAAGASTLNQYLDRDMDVHMARTRSRPIPSGRVKPGQALAFGLALSALSTAILGFEVNWLAAGLALAGWGYYVGIYTLVLKRSTPLNIIIGGGAGAFPVLVGWAAATGTLGPGAYLLFAMIFFWTPPHSWALAVLVESDYERARVPMMPVACGSELTRQQIVWFSLELVVVTLLPLPFGILSWVYFGCAVLLGIGLIWRSLSLLGRATGAAARQMYKYSSAYLALLFLAMIVDRVIIR